LNIDVSANTDIGQKRARNEDNFLCLSSSMCPEGIDAVLVVADGMGGHAGGDVASRIAVETFTGVFSNNAFKPNEMKKALRDSLNTANKLIFQEGKTNPEGSMGTTCTAAILMDGVCYLGHVGDSRGYLLRNRQISQLTEDHSWVAQLVKEGHISTEQARVHPNRNVITKALGIDSEVESDFIEFDMESGDRLLLCSDGLHGLIEDSLMRDILMNVSPDEAVELLIRKANENGGYDNITVAVALVR
jgi:protein phosphatase